MIIDKKRVTPPEPHVETDDDGPGNSIVQAAYSAGLFSDQGAKSDAESSDEDETLGA